MSNNWARRGTASLASLALVVSFIVIGAARADAACDLTPLLRDVTINQGLGSYTPLAAGKTTLVRAYLSLPSCANTTTDAVEIRAGSVTVSGGTAPQNTPASPAPASPYAQAATFAAAPALDAPADLKFPVPGSALTNATNTAFTATFSFSVTFASRTSPVGSWTPGTVAYTTKFGSAATITAPVAKPTNNLRVLVVPLVDKSVDTALTPQYPAASTTTLQQGMKAVSRLLPVRDGIGDLATAGNGIRYGVTSNLDVGPNGLALTTAGKLCIQGLQWDTLGGALAQQLQAWNSANTSAQADRVVGVTWRDSSNDSSSGCADGLSTVGSPESVIRLIPDAGQPYNTKSNAGALMTHELVHTMGGVPTGASNSDNNYHSKNGAADGTAPGRDYNVTTRQFLGTGARTDTYPGTNATDVNALLEPQDYALAQCTLTTGATGCPLPASVGTALAGPAIVVSGSTNGTAAGTSLHTYFDSDVERQGTDTSSPYHLVQYGATSNVVSDVRIRAKTQTPSEILGGPPSTVGRVSINVAIDLNSLATSFAVNKDGVSGPLFTRAKDTAPVFVNSTRQLQVTALTNYTNVSGDDTQPALTSDGKLLAWVDSTGIRVRPVDKSTAATAAGAKAGFEPSWSQAKDTSGNWHLLYTSTAGEIHDVSVTATGTPTFGLDQVIYNASVAGLVGNTPGSHASYNSTGQQVIVGITNDLWRIDLTAPFTASPITCAVDPLVSTGCHNITSTPAVAEKRPSVSTGNVIAYEHDADVWTAFTDGTSQGLAVTGASHPTYGGSVLVFEQGGNIKSADTNPPTTLTNGGTDTWPAVDAGMNSIALDRLVGSQHDIFTSGIDRNVVTATVNDNLPGNLRLDVFVQCGSLLVPLVVGRPVTSSTSGSGSWVVPVDPNSACNGGTLVLRATDGWQTATANDGSTGVQHDPSAAIYSPPMGSAWLQFDAIPVSGLGLDTEDRVLPDAKLTWSLSGPNGAYPIPGTSTGATLPDLQPPAGGWPTSSGGSTWTLTLTVTDNAGRTASVSTTYTVLPDADHDGIPASKDTTCGGANADNDPTNANGDPDHDGIPTRDDSAPCTSANNASINFDPDTLNTGSTGTPVTTYVTFNGGNLSQVPRTSVRIVQIGNYATNFVAISWSVCSGSSATAQFDRVAINNFLIQNGLKGMYVPFVISGTNTAQTFTFRGVDASSPITS